MKKYISLICAALLPFCAQPPPAHGQGLPPGYYVYFGSQPGTTPPQALTIVPSGRIFWQSAEPSQSKNSSQNTSVSANSSETSSDSGESFNYPVFKFAPRPIPQIPGAYVQLSTTFENSYSRSSYGKVRYQATVYKAASLPRGLKIDLLDSDGFMLAEFSLGAADFSVVSGTSLLQAKGEKDLFKEVTYRKARSFSVK